MDVESLQRELVTRVVSRDLVEFHHADTDVQRGPDVRDDAGVPGGPPESSDHPPHVPTPSHTISRLRAMRGRSPAKRACASFISSKPPLSKSRSADRRMSRSVRRVLSSHTVAGTRRTVIHLGYSLPSTSSGLPASSGGAALERLLSDLASGGVYLATPVTWSAGGLLHHRFTLTPTPFRPKPDGSPWRSIFCGTVPRVAPGGR